MKEITSLPTWQDAEFYLNKFQMNPVLTLNAVQMANDERYKDIHDAFSKGQLCSKFWIRDVMLNKVAFVNVSNIIVVGAWYGMLAHIMPHKINTKLVLSDIDKECIHKNKRLFQGVGTCQYEYETIDMHERDYSAFDLIINTSTEHIKDISEWTKKIPDNKYVLLQGNNLIHPDHPSNTQSVEELLSKINFKECLYLGEMHLPKYKRFMVIVKT